MSLVLGGGHDLQSFKCIEPRDVEGCGRERPVEPLSWEGGYVSTLSAPTTPLTLENTGSYIALGLG